MGSCIIIGIVVLGVVILYWLSRQCQKFPRLAALMGSGPVVPSVKASALNFTNALNRVGIDSQNFYMDFTGEGATYPLHGSGDSDKISDLLSAICKSVSGKPFVLRDLQLEIQTVRNTVDSSFIDFHAIPVNHLDGSTKLPDGSRIEQHIPEFNSSATRDFNTIAKLDMATGMATFPSPPQGWPTGRVPTTLASTRATPYLSQGESLALAFFADGPQARVNNGGRVTNYRYVVPMYTQSITWFVARAWVPTSDAGHPNAQRITTTSGKSMLVRPRTSAETENIHMLRGKNRIMETVSKAVEIKDGAARVDAFQQRYSHKCIDFGELMMMGAIQDDGSRCAITPQLDAVFQMWVNTKPPHEQQRQIGFYEIITQAADYLRERNVLPSPYVRVQTGSEAFVVFMSIKERYLNANTYNISPTALCAKAQLGKIYMPTPVGDTGWMVVDTDGELPVPETEGEYFIGWKIDTQPPGSTRVRDRANPAIDWCLSHGYKIHQGPGIIFVTGGDYAHSGAQEPYLLEHESRPIPSQNETQAQLEARIEAQKPYVHWRLDSPSVIGGSLKLGAWTEANVGAGQRPLLSVGTTTPRSFKSRSENFLGSFDQRLLSDREKLKQYLADYPIKDKNYVVTRVM